MRKVVVGAEWTFEWVNVKGGTLSFFGWLRFFFYWTSLTEGKRDVASKRKGQWLGKSCCVSKE